MFDGVAWLLFDDAGYRMVATHATKNRVRYRYYVSQPHLRGGTKAQVGAISRVPASDIEAVVIKAITAHFGNPNNPTTDDNQTDREMVAARVARIDVRKNQLAVRLKSPDTDQTVVSDHTLENDRPTSFKDVSNPVLLIPWRKPPSRKFRDILLPPSASRHEVRPIRAERRAALIKSIARGRHWLDEIVSGAMENVEQIATRQKCSVRHVNMTISMAFLAPALVKAAVEGRLPRGVGVASLRDAPPEWSRQLAMLGLADQLA